MPSKQSYPTTSHHLHNHLHMKLPSSSYSSPSSCSAASYHLNSDAAAAAGCFSGILRRLVCNTLDVGSSSSSSRSRVADAGTDAAVLQPPEKDHGISLRPPPATPPSAPGIVARLMGLDSMPELPSAHPIGRSRSTGSLDGWPVLLPVPSTSHRRSHSFREAPTFLRPENDEFLLLSFSPENNGDETKKSPQPPPTSANHLMGLRQLDQRDAVEEETRERPSQTERAAEKTPTKQQKKKKTTTNAQRKTRERPSQTQRSAEKTPTKQQQKKKTTNAQRKTSREKTATHREAPERTRPTNKKKSSVSPKTMAAELDCSSQNSSPVSVLDRRLPELDGESLTDTSMPISDEEEEEPRPEGSPRRKLSSPVDCFDDPSQFFHLILVDDKEGSISMATTDQERRGAGTGDAAAAASLPHSSSHLWTEATRLAAGDAQRQPWKAQNPEELVAEFGLQILESLLQETVDEFCHVPSAQ